MNPIAASWTTPGMLHSRIDPEFYSPEALREARWIHDGRHDLRRLDDCLSLLTDGVHETPEFVDSGVTYLTASNIDECQLSPGKGHKFIAEATYLRYDRMKCAPKAGDVLLSKSGRIGYAAVVPPGLRFAVLHSAAILRPTEVDAHFLAVFIHSRHGQSQIDRFQKGAVQPMLHLEEIAEIRIPRTLPDIQRAIGNKLRKAERLRELAAAARARLDRWIEGNAGGRRLPLADRPFLDHAPSSTIRDWSWVTSVPTADRIDPWPHHVAPRTIRGHLEQHGRTTTLAKLAKRVTDSRLRIEFTDPNQAGHYVSVLDVDSDGRIDWNNARVSRYAGSGYELQPGDILYSGINPRQPRVAAIPPDASGLLVGSPEFVILKPLTSLFGHPNLLAAVFRSGWVRVQATFLTRSSSLSRRRIDEEDLDQILVPWSDDRLDEMEVISVHALDGDIEANNLVAAAKAAVEALINGTLDGTALLAESDVIERWLAENPSPSKGA